MRGYAISSFVPEYPITADRATALIDNLRRAEEWWAAHPLLEWNGLKNVDVVWSPVIGAVPADPELSVVQIVRTISTPGDIAEHTQDELGRPVCLISYEAAMAESGGLPDGPNGVTSAASHEINEARRNPTCQRTVLSETGKLNPDGKNEPYEVCDRVQGTDYVEPGSPGIYVANVVGPRFFIAGETGALDIRSDVTTPGITVAFGQTPEGYHEEIEADGSTKNVFGKHVSEAVKARVDRNGPRGGAIHAAMT